MLRRRGLGFDEGGRLRTLPPVRHHVADAHRPSAEDLDRAVGHYVALARQLGGRVGRSGGDEAAARLAPESANLDAVMGVGLAGDDPRPALDAAVTVARFVYFSGVPLAALADAERIGDARRQAHSIKSLGDIALARSDHDGAWAAFDEALPLYRQVGDVLGQANCIVSLGDIALARSDHDAAWAAYTKAHGLYEGIAEPFSIGTMHRKLAAMATTNEDRCRHAQAARAAWQRIDRGDLVAGLSDLLADCHDV